MTVEVITGRTPEEFAAKFNKAAERYDNPDIKFLDDMKAYIYGNKTEPTCKSCCADCIHYEWQKWCKLTGDNKRPTDIACDCIER